LQTGLSADPVWSDGELGGALRLRGLEWLDVPHGPAVDQRGNATFELWFNAEAFPNTWMPLVYKGNGGDQRTYDLWLRSNGALFLSTTDVSGEQSITTAGGLVTPGQWYHVAGVIDRTNQQMRLYLNGVQIDSRAVRPAQALSFATPLMIGGTSETNTTYTPFYGRIDEVRVWNVARTASQIVAAKDAPLAGDDRAGLVLYLPLDQSSGRIASDASASAASATLRGRFDDVPGAVVGEISVPARSTATPSRWRRPSASISTASSRATSRGRSAGHAARPSATEGFRAAIPSMLRRCSILSRATTRWRSTHRAMTSARMHSACSTPRRRWR
jgi:hypothetical protein